MSSASSTLSPPVPRSAAPATERSGPGLLVLLAATFMTALDLFIVNVAIPAVQSDLHAGSAAIQWVVAGFGLAVATGLITAGRLGDIFGRRRMFGYGLALFTLTSAGCGLAPTAGTLVAARVLQGLSAALMGPQVLAILQSAYTGKAQARAFGMYGLTMGVGAVFGQLIGGLLIKADLFGLGWRACFLINVPVGLVALALVPQSARGVEGAPPASAGQHRCGPVERRRGRPGAAADPGPGAGLAAVDLAVPGRERRAHRGVRRPPEPADPFGRRPRAEHRALPAARLLAGRPVPVGVLDRPGLVLPDPRALPPGGPRAERPGVRRGLPVHRRRLPADLHHRPPDRRPPGRPYGPGRIAG